MVIEAPQVGSVRNFVSITGRVLGESGELFAGASIRILQKGKLKSLGITNEKGEFKLW